MPMFTGLLESYTLIAQRLVARVILSEGPLPSQRPAWCKHPTPVPRGLVGADYLLIGSKLGLKSFTRTA